MSEPINAPTPTHSWTGKRADSQSALLTPGPSDRARETAFGTPSAGQSTPTGGSYPSCITLPTTFPTNFGRYELLKELGRGAMGVVYLARQIGLERRVALKLLLQGENVSEQEVQRFLQEARAMAQLEHSNIVAVYEAETHQGRHFISMAFVEGQSLKDEVKNAGKPTPTQVVDWLIEMADAVNYAHRKGIIHRDLKPENVLIDQDKHARVADFGLAKFSPNSGGDDSFHTLQSHDSGLTRQGQVIGTPNYLSPEQAFGQLERIGPKSDVYCLGGILYFLLTGRPPFLGTLHEVLYKVVNTEPEPPRKLDAKVPAVLQEICLKCLQKDPDDRYPSAGALATALREAKTRLTGGPTTGTGLGRWVKAIAAVAVVMVLVTVIWGGWSYLPLSTPPTESSRPKSPDPEPNPEPSPGVQLAREKANDSIKGIEKRLVQFGPLVGPTERAEIRTYIDRLKTANKGEDENAIKRAVGALEGVAEGVFELRQPLLSQRQDFGLEVEVVGARPGADGLLIVPEGYVRFRIKVDRDAYVSVWSLNANGSVVQLFPNFDETDNQCKAGTVREVPKPKGKARLRAKQAQPPGAVEWFWVEATSEKLAQVKGQRVQYFRQFEGQVRQQFAAQRGTARLKREVFVEVADTDTFEAPGITPERIRAFALAERVLKYEVRRAP